MSCFKMATNNILSNLKTFAPKQLKLERWIWVRTLIFYSKNYCHFQMAAIFLFFSKPSYCDHIFFYTTRARKLKFSIIKIFIFLTVMLKIEPNQLNHFKKAANLPLLVIKLSTVVTSPAILLKLKNFAQLFFILRIVMQKI